VLKLRGAFAGAFAVESQAVDAGDGDGVAITCADPRRVVVQLVWWVRSVDTARVNAGRRDGDENGHSVTVLVELMVLIEYPRTFQRNVQSILGTP
jgi:hypothetical protein